ncbi:MAG: hypothetical protein LBT95_01140 [Treponema sp.]|jgi:hypothetical protein|nr:hypothetical protein [Treponema sp.]
MRTGVSFNYRCGSLVAAFLLLLSCTRSVEEIPLLPPPTHPLSRALIGYGVVSASYTHVMELPDQGGISLGYLRRGSVVPVLERRYVNNQGKAELWVLVEGNYRGWLKDDAILIYDNEARAKTAAESMTQ